MELKIARKIGGRQPSPPMQRDVIELAIAGAYDDALVGRPFRKVSRPLGSRISAWTHLIAHPNMVALFHYRVYDDGVPEEVHIVNADELKGDAEAVSALDHYIEYVNRIGSSLRSPGWDPGQIMAAYQRPMRRMSTRFDERFAEVGTLPYNCVVIVHSDERGGIRAFALAVINGDVIYPDNRIQRTAQAPTTYLKGAFI